MRAVTLNGFGEPLSQSELAVPEPGPGQVRVRVKAAGLNPFDNAVANGMMQGMVEYAFPVVIGRDAAGIVDAVGEGVTEVTIGDDVFGHVLLGSPLHDGTLAEYALLPARAVTAKPEQVDFVSAAALPLSGTAAHAAVEAVAPREGATVLIVGATGGVGSYAIQLAAARGATVIATGLPEDAQRLRGLGATHVVDYRQPLAEQVRSAAPDGVDGLIDLVNREPDGLNQVATLVRDGGRVATTMGAADPEKLATRNITAANVMAAPVRDVLKQLGEQVASGALRVDVEQVLPLQNATQGLETLAAGTARGKIVVKVED
jgi:NADPH:quinone reductase-like Zn-dependent oxidoreductase